jgi:hypothetical protein
MKFKILFLFLAIVQCSFSQTTLYLEDFETVANDNKGQNGTTYDMNGVTNWIIDPSGGSFSSGDYMKQTSGEFRVTDADGSSGDPVVWQSLNVDISCYINVNVSLDLIGSSSSSNSFQAYYSTNGGTTWSAFGGALAGNASATRSGALPDAVTSIMISVRFWGSYSTAYMGLDNVLITGDYSVATCPIPPAPPICGGSFTDSDAGTAVGNYANNINYTSTICPDVPGELTTVTMVGIDIGAGDFLYVYEGDDVTGVLLATVNSSTPVGASVSSYNCITFNWVTDGNDNGNEGYHGIIECDVPFQDNPVAADDFADAPMICDLSSYSGTTTGNTADLPFDIKPSGNSSNAENCPATTFQGKIDNNSWLKFVATSTSVTMDVTPGACQLGWDGGIQMAILAFDGGSFTRVSDCSYSGGGESSLFSITGSPLVVGEIYYIMVDGNAGAKCPYTIEMDAGFTSVTAAASHDTICTSGDPVDLTVVNGSSTSNYVWFADEIGFGSEEGSPVTVNPSATTTYTLVDNGECPGETSSVTVILDVCSTLPVNFLGFSAECKSDFIQLNWQTASEINNDYFVIEKAGADMNFIYAGTVSGSGNSSVINHYAFQDFEVLSTNVYYRLVQYDYNGEQSYSDIVSVAQCEEFDYEIKNTFYNSYQEELVVTYNVNKTAVVNVKIFDVQGKLVVDNTEILYQNQNQLIIPVKKLVKNTFYLMSIISSSSVDTKKVFISNQTF